MQLNHEQNKFQPKQFPLTLVCDHIYFQDNIGSLFRISEAFGVEKIIFIGKNIPLNPRKINKTSRSTHLKIPYEIIESDIIASYLNDFEKIALEITSESQKIEDLEINSGKKIALIVGSEISGISEELLAICDKTVHIEMFGSNSSMNVVQATGIALYEITKKLQA